MRELELHREGLQTVWLLADPDQPGEVVERWPCERCQPHQAQIVMCDLCGDTVMIGGELASMADSVADVCVALAHQSRLDSARRRLDVSRARGHRYMTTDDRKFNKHRIPPLAQEAESAASLLAHGIELVRQIGTIEPSPMFACLAMGAEKLLKLSIGLLSWETAGAWPSRPEMRNRLGHNIGEMHARTLNALADRLAEPSTVGSARKAISALRQEVVEDPIVTFALMALSDYAQQGRFYNLDILARFEQLAPSPRDRWNELEKDIVALNPAAAAMLGTDRWTTEGQPLINNQIADSLLRWWRLHQRSWNTGALGRQAQLWSTRLGNP